MITTYPPERRRMLNHEILLIPKVASTTLREITEPPTHRLPQIAFIREPLQRWCSGYIMWLLDLARFSDGSVRFHTPYHTQYDMHTTLQRYSVKSSTHCIKLDHINTWADRCNVTLPHLHKTSTDHSHLTQKLHQFLKKDEQFSYKLRLYLRSDYQLYDKATSVQSLPDKFFTK